VTSANDADVGSAAFPTLTDEQIAVLEDYGERRRIEAGEALFREGEPYYDFYVVLDGEIEIVETVGGRKRTITVRRPNEFVGEMGLLTGQSAYLSGVVRRTGEVIAISPRGRNAARPPAKAARSTPRPRRWAPRAWPSSSRCLPWSSRWPYGHGILRLLRSVGPWPHTSRL